MTSTSSVYPRSSGYTGSMSQIYDIIRRHSDSLLDRRWKANQAIDDWSTGLMNEIREHALQQKRLVEQAYTHQQDHLKNMREQFVATSLIYERKGNTQDLDQLLEKCRAIQVELVKLNFRPCDKDFIEVTPIEPQDQLKENNVDPGKTTDDKSGKQLTPRGESDFVYDKDANSSSYPRSTSTNSNRLNQQPSTSQYTGNNDRSINTNNNNPKPGATGDGNSNEKCPTCFMIFPSNMSETARLMHANEHFKDD